jgi:hypothetical protein
MFGRKKTNFGDRLPKAEIQLEESHRLAAQIKIESATCHPLVFAAKMVGFLSPSFDSTAPKHVTVEDIDQLTLCDDQPEGSTSVGVSFRFIGQRGEQGGIYFFDDWAAIWPKGESSPRMRMPVENLQKYVNKYPEALKEVLAKVKPAQSQSDELQARQIREQLSQFLG